MIVKRWSRISSINVGVRKFLLVKCSQAISNWIKKYAVFCFCKFSCLLDLRICFCLKRPSPCLEFRNKFNQYSIRSFQRALALFDNLWIHFIFREFNWVFRPNRGLGKVPGRSYFVSIPEEMVYSFFNILLDIFCNSIYFTCVPQLVWELLVYSSIQLGGIKTFCPLGYILSTGSYFDLEVLGWAYSSCFMHAAITCMRLPFFKIFSNVEHFPTNF